MSNIHQMHQHSTRKQDQARWEERRLDAASDWIARIERGLTDVEQQQLQCWLAGDTSNTLVLLELAQLWDKMDDLSRLSDLFPQHARVNAGAHKKTALWSAALAASVAIALSLGVYLGVGDWLPFVTHEQSAVIAMQKSYQTAIGESNTIHLPDNSKIVLNTNSYVQVTYTPTARIIDLQRGEIHIDVAHDKSRPLSVLAAGKVIQAVGTAFNVEVRSKLVELIVTEGKVLIGNNKIPAFASNIEEAGAKLPNNSMAISKGEKINLDLTGQHQEKAVKVDSVEMAASLSWRQGNLIFRGESLGDAMAEISRYTNIEFELADDENLRQVHVAGMFKTGDVTALLNVLKQNFNIGYEKVNNEKIILKYSG